MPDEPDASRFERIVTFLARHFRVMRLTDAVEALSRGALPAAAACITFDDGYADNLEVAAPILHRHGLSATFFIATGYTGGGRMWNDTVVEALRAAPAGRLDWSDLGVTAQDISDGPSRARAIHAVLNAFKYLSPEQRAERVDEVARRGGLPARSDLMMDVAQLRALVDLGMDIGGHTVSHPILSRLDDAAARDEIGAGREQLTSWLGNAPTVFAYPNGVPGRDFGLRDLALVRSAGFSAAVTTARGHGDRSTDPFLVPRFTPWDHGMARFGARLAADLVVARRPASMLSRATSC